MGKMEYQGVTEHAASGFLRLGLYFLPLHLQLNCDTHALSFRDCLLAMDRTHPFVFLNVLDVRPRRAEKSSVT